MKSLKFHRAIVAIAMMLIGWLPSLAHDFEVDGIFYNKTSDNTAAVTYKGVSQSSYSNEYEGDVVIPSSVNYEGITYSVTSIGGSAFWYCSSLTSIQIPNSVTSIGDEAFSYCESLTSVIWNSVRCSDFYFDSPFENCPNITSFTFGDEVEHIPAYLCCNLSKLTSIQIPNSVTSIGEWAFYYCKSLTSIEIPNSVTSIGYAAFLSCSSLTSIQIPNSVTSIGDYAFKNCSSLTSIEIPNSVTSIGYESFSCCSSLTSVEIGNSVTSIGNYAFSECSSLASVEIGNSVTSIGEAAFAYCYDLTNIEIGNSVTSIGYGAFAYCAGLASLVIPNSVTSIGGKAFYDCYSLTKITCLATNPPAIVSTTFSNYSAELYVPTGCISAYQSAIYWKNFNIIIDTLDNPITLNDNDVTVASIGDYIVVKNAKLGSVVNVYTVDGTMIASEVTTEGDVIIEAPAKGIYVVKVGKQTVKVII